MVYFESLKDRNPEAVQMAIISCRETLDYIPKLHEIIDRLSTTATPFDPKLYGKLVKDWVEPFTDRANLHVYEFENGSRLVKQERIHAD